VKTGDLVGNENVSDTMFQVRSRLVEFGNCDAGGPRGKLALRDTDGLVGHGVRAEADTAIGGELRHAGDVVFQAVELDDYGRSVQIVEVLRHCSEGVRWADDREHVHPRGR